MRKSPPRTGRTFAVTSAQFRNRPHSFASYANTGLCRHHTYTQRTLVAVNPCGNNSPRWKKTTANRPRMISPRVQEEDQEMQDPVFRDSGTSWPCTRRARGPPAGPCNDFAQIEPNLSIGPAALSHVPTKLKREGWLTNVVERTEWARTASVPCPE